MNKQRNKQIDGRTRKGREKGVQMYERGEEKRRKGGTDKKRDEQRW